jgi:excisionase family DNA binding protein
MGPVDELGASGCPVTVPWSAPRRRWSFCRSGALRALRSDLLGIADEGALAELALFSLGPLRASEGLTARNKPIRSAFASTGGQDAQPVDVPSVRIRLLPVMKTIERDSGMKHLLEDDGQDTAIPNDAPYDEPGPGRFIESERMYNASEVAAFLRVHKHTVFRCFRDGLLPGVKVAGMWRISESALRAFLRGETGQASPHLRDGETQVTLKGKPRQRRAALRPRTHGQNQYTKRRKEGLSE